MRRSHKRKGAQAYALVDLELLCSDELPLVGLCLNLFQGNPLEVRYSEACKVTLPNLDPIQAGLFLRPLEQGHWYTAVGISSASGGAGLSFADLDVLSFDTLRF